MLSQFIKRWNLTWLLIQVRLCLVVMLIISEISRYTCAIQSFQPFNDAQTLNPYYGESSQNLEHLGRMIKLQASVDKFSIFPCTFTIQTRLKETQVEFSPNWYCLLGVCGNYKFDLNLLAQSRFNPNARTIILIAGYMSDVKTEWIERIAELWLAIEDVNVIKVSWNYGNRYRYERAVSGTPIVAREITILLHHLAAMNGFRFTDHEFAKRIQIVGHSLGAHIGGFVGQDFGGRLGRITGLDPAGVFFDLQPRVQRLDPTDARLVDVIHTNAGKLRYMDVGASVIQAGADYLLSKVPGVNGLHSRVKRTMGEGYTREANTSWFGIDQQVGHIDLYANNGKAQPDCDSYMHVCDHGRSHEIYEDFLVYELNRLNMPLSADHQAKGDRLLAFKSDDYDSFFVGTNLAKMCKSILSVDSQMRQGLGDLLKKCSLPVDLTGQIDDLIHEYANDYRVESLSNLPAAELPDVKYYFSTRGQRTFIGNHFMLKINPYFVQESWSPGCTLKAEIMLPDAINSTKITMLKDTTKAVGVSDIIGGQFKFTALFTLPSERPLRFNESSEFRSFLPSSVHLRASPVKVSDSTIRAAVNKVWGHFSIKAGVRKCSMIIQSVEIVPLIGSERAFVGHYKESGGNFLSVDKELELRLASIDITSGTSLISYARTQRQVHDRIGPVIQMLLGQTLDNVNGTKSQFKDRALNDRSNSDLADSTAQEIIERSGYRQKTYGVVSGDGYITQLINIINPLVERKNLKRPPVVLFHGGITDNTCWVLSNSIQHHPEKYPRDFKEDGPITSFNRSLGFMLANNGYDVWLASTRGSNRQNMGHVKYRTKSFEHLFVNLLTRQETIGSIGRGFLDNFSYFDYSFDEIVKHEVPRQLEAILQLTGRRKVSVIAYSFSTIMMFKVLVSNEALKKRIHTYVALNPLLNSVGTSRMMRSLWNWLPTVPQTIGTLISQLILTGPVKVALRGSDRYGTFKLLTTLIAGSSAKYNTFLDDPFVGHVLLSAGFKQMAHSAQMLLAGQLQKYNYGLIKNVWTYGQTTPPVYDLSKFNLRRWMIVANLNDQFGTPSSTDEYLKRIKVKPYKVIRNTGFNHVDTYAGFENDIKINLPILKFLDRFQIS